MIRALAAATRRWVVPPSSGQHWDLLDGLRGVAILMVVAAHGVYANPAGPAWSQWISAFCQSGFLGVPVFFVLSGFLISLPFLKARAKSPAAWWVPGYPARRALKIAPPFYLCLVVLAVYYVWRYGEMRYVRTAMQWAVGIPHVIYVPYHFNGSFWSLWVEIGFYALLPLLFLGSRGTGVLATASIIALILLVVPFLTRLLDPPGPGAEPLFLLYNRGRFPNSLTNFAWGVLFAGWYVARGGAQAAGHPRLAAGAGWAGVTLILTVMAVRAHGLMTGWESEILVTEVFVPLTGIATCLMLGFLFAPASLGARLLSSPLLRFLGIVSYEWFLFHQPAFVEVRSWLGSAGGSLGRYVLIVLGPALASLLAAAITYHFYSMPILKAGRRWLERTPRDTGTRGVTEPSS